MDYLWLARGERASESTRCSAAARGATRVNTA